MNWSDLRKFGMKRFQAKSKAFPQTLINLPSSLVYRKSEIYSQDQGKTISGFPITFVLLQNISEKGGQEESQSAVLKAHSWLMGCQRVHASQRLYRLLNHSGSHQFVLFSTSLSLLILFLFSYELLVISKTMKFLSQMLHKYFQFIFKTQMLNVLLLERISGSNT